MSRQYWQNEVGLALRKYSQAWLSSKLCLAVLRRIWQPGRAGRLLLWIVSLTFVMTVAARRLTAGYDRVDLQFACTIVANVGISSCRYQYLEKGCFSITQRLTC